MSRIQMIVTTMNATDDSLYDKMNLQTDAIIANQTDFDDLSVNEYNNNRVLLVSTKTRGTSKNRNIGIDNLDDNTEFVVFSDDDLIWKDGYEKYIIDSFLEHPEVDAIRFNLNCISRNTLSMKTITNFHIASKMEAGSWGVCGLAIRKNVLIEKKIRFNERFGPGTSNYKGEDTIFIFDLFKNNIRIGCVPIVIADINQDSSSWFNGYDRKYFIVSGMVFNEIYPLFCYALAIRSSIKAFLRKNNDLGFFEILFCYFKGIADNIKEKKRCNNE